MNPFCTIILPVFNEEKAVAPVIHSIKKEMAGYETKIEILAVDDGSTDSTGEKLREIDGIKVITRENNYGYGAAIKTGIAAANGEKILIMDADSSYPEEQINRMMNLSKDYDMVVGARKSPFIKHFFVRGILRYLFKVSASILMWTWIPDLNSGMRIFDTKIVRAYLDFLPDGFSASSTLTAIFIRKKHSIFYTSIPYRTRIGISKINLVLDAFRFLRFLFTTWPNIEKGAGNLK